MVVLDTPKVPMPSTGDGDGMDVLATPVAGVRDLKTNQQTVADEARMILRLFLIIRG